MHKSILTEERLYEYKLEAEKGFRPEEPQISAAKRKGTNTSGQLGHCLDYYCCINANGG